MKFIKTLTITAIVLLIIGEIAAVLIKIIRGLPGMKRQYRAFHLFQMVIAIFISYLIFKEIKKGIDVVDKTKWSRISVLVFFGSCPFFGWRHYQFAFN